MIQRPYKNIYEINPMVVSNQGAKNHYHDFKIDFSVQQFEFT